MLDSLTEKFRQLLGRLGQQKTLSEENIAEAVREVRLALLDADVNYSVVSRFVKRVKERALGQMVIRSVDPKDQFVEIVHKELVDLMGAEESSLDLSKSPSVMMLCGLQGSGKTTTAAKLAYFLQKKNPPKKVLVAACDLARPAAVEQLKQLCQSICVPVFSMPSGNNPVVVAEQALVAATQGGFDVLIIDTAGRVHVDDELMEELSQIKKVVAPSEVLFVANSTTGQDAVKTAAEFDAKVSITGTILTMLDGNSRSGAAISIREVTQKPLKFEGTGERVADFQSFHPSSMADRILGMGDVVNLVRLAKEEFDEAEAAKLEKKIQKALFTYDDYLQQMKAIKRMGPLKGLLQMIPGASQMPNLDQSEAEFTQIEAMILSMTPKERLQQVELIPSRRWRIAKGSGVQLDEVNRLVKKFKQMKEMMKSFPKKGLQDLGLPKNVERFFK